MTMQMSQIVQQCLQLDSKAIISIKSLFDIKDELTSLLSDRKMFVAVLDGGQESIGDVDSLLETLSNRCGFPDYFGYNWNALLDCLTDFEWMPAEGYFLIYLNPFPFRSHEPQEWNVFVDVINYACERWLKRNKPFKLLIPSE